MKTQSSNHAEKINGVAMSSLPIVGDFSHQLEALQDVIANGNLSSLSTEGRLKYIASVCDSLHLNPLTRPFEFITLKGKLTLYARKDCTEQLRKIHGVSFKSVDHRKMDDLYIVTVKAADKTGRTDIATGVIPIGGVKGDDLANLIMKTETKAKRRATLSICGLGILDESELDTVSEKNVTPVSDIDEDKKKKLSQKIEQRKLENVNLKQVTLVNSSDVETIKMLVAELRKPDNYIRETINKKYGHFDLSKITEEFAKKWIENLQKQSDSIHQFIDEMDGDCKE